MRPFQNGFALSSSSTERFADADLPLRRPVLEHLDEVLRAVDAAQLHLPLGDALHHRDGTLVRDLGDVLVVAQLLLALQRLERLPAAEDDVLRLLQARRLHRPEEVAHIPYLGAGVVADEHVLLSLRLVALDRVDLFAVLVVDGDARGTGGGDVAALCVPEGLEHAHPGDQVLLHERPLLLDEVVALERVLQRVLEHVRDLHPLHDRLDHLFRQRPRLDVEDRLRLEHRREHPLARVQHVRGSDVRVPVLVRLDRLLRRCSQRAVGVVAALDLLDPGVVVAALTVLDRFYDQLYCVGLL